MTTPPRVCPECGAAVRELPRPSEGSVLLACSRCPWRAASTNRHAPPFDPQRYSVFAVATMPARLLVVKLAMALGRPARELSGTVAGDRPLAEDVHAVEVLRIAGLLAPCRIGLRTEPPFPWPVPEVGSRG